MCKMVNLKEASVQESGLILRTWLRLLCLLVGLTSKVGRFLNKAWAMRVKDPKKVIHCFKVAMALTFVSLFFYLRPLYKGVGQNGIWAVMTVVVVFEYTVGATISKSLNRIAGTILADSLAIGINWIARESGEGVEPIILGATVFLLASAVTFSRFIPAIKAGGFDYGAMIFILTFSMISVSGCRVDNFLQMAFQRMYTIAVGACVCMLISMLVYPIWAGEELHLLITCNMEKLANSLDGCVTEYFKEKNSNGTVDNGDEAHKSLLGYKCVLNSEAAEGSFANFARWEPAHGRYLFRHPWKQYLKIGLSMRNCAYCMEVLNGYIGSEVQFPDLVKKRLSNACIILSSHCSRVLKELAITITTMRRSIKIELYVGEMKEAVKELQNVLKSLPNLFSTPPPEAPEDEKKEPISTPTNLCLTEVVPLVTVTSLLIEIVAQIEGVVEAVNELANLADFKPDIDKLKQLTDNSTSDYQDQQTMKALQQV